MAVLLLGGTAGVSVHQHICAMMGASVSIAPQVSCCGERTHAQMHDGMNPHETLSRTPCCDDAVRHVSVTTEFESAPSPRPVLLAVTMPQADVTDDDMPRFVRLPRIADDISPHIQRSLAETVNNLLS